MRFVTVKHLCDGFALVRRERCDINERLHPLAAYRSNDGPSVRMASQDDGTTCSFECASQRRNVVSQRSKRDGSTRDRKTLALDRENDVLPTGAVGPCSMDQNDRGVLGRGIH